MVDDVAWGVGWGTDGDDASHMKPYDEPELQNTNSRSRPTGLKLQTTIVWEQEERSPSLTFSPASLSSLNRGRRTTESTSRSRSPSFVPSTPPDGARVSPITDLSENLECRLNFSTRETLSLKSSLDPDENLVAKPVQRAAEIEDEIANWTTRIIERDDDTEVDAILESKTLMTPMTFSSDLRRSGSVTRPNIRWANAKNTNHLYPDRRPIPAEPFLNLGSTPSLPRCRSAEYRYFD